MNTTTTNPLDLSDQIHDDLQAIIAIADLMTAANPYELPDRTLGQLGPHVRHLAQQASERAEALWQHYRKAEGMEE